MEHDQYAVDRISPGLRALLDQGPMAPPETPGYHIRGGHHRANQPLSYSDGVPGRRIAMGTFDESIYRRYEASSPFEIKDTLIPAVSVDVLDVPEDEREFAASFRTAGEDLHRAQSRSLVQ